MFIRPINNMLRAIFSMLITYHLPILDTKNRTFVSFPDRRHLCVEIVCSPCHSYCRLDRKGQAETWLAMVGRRQWCCYNIFCICILELCSILAIYLFSDNPLREQGLCHHKCTRNPRPGRTCKCSHAPQTTQTHTNTHTTHNTRRTPAIHISV